MPLSKVEKSRRDWKSKATLRTSKISNLKKTAARQQKRAVQNADNRALVQRLLQENKELRAALFKHSSNTPANSASPIACRALCVFIIIRGIIPFRSVPRILGIFQPLLHHPITIPHFTSVIHWTLRAGVALYNQVVPLVEPWVALIDCSIDIGTRKALVISPSL